MQCSKKYRMNTDSCGSILITRIVNKGLAIIVTWTKFCYIIVCSWARQKGPHDVIIYSGTVKPVCSDHLYNKMYYL